MARIAGRLAAVRAARTLQSSHCSKRTAGIAFNIVNLCGVA
jgi:hypothetical protein